MYSNTRFPWFVRLFALLFAAHSWADSVTLVTGEKITGTIKSETASELTIDIPVSASITDERVIRKEDIAKVEKEQPDEIAFRQLAALQPNPQSSYSSQTYEQILASLNAFQANYPASGHLPEVQKLAAAFQDEKKHVDAGQIKYLGQWITSDEAARRRIQIVAMQINGTMQQQAGAGDLVSAMQTFAALERDYATTRSYPPAVSLAQQILARLEQDLVVRMQEVKADQDQLQKTIAFTAEPEKSNIIAAAKAEQDRNTQIIDAAVKSGSKWVPLIPRSLISIDTLQKTVATEAPRLAAIPVAAMNQSIEKVDGARNAMATGDLKTADSLLKDAAALWAQNEAAHYWTDRLKEKMAAASATPTPAATPKTLPSVARTTPQPASVAAAPPLPPPVAETPFYMTPTGGIAIAAVVLIGGGLGASYFQKKKKAGQQAAE